MRNSVMRRKYAFIRIKDGKDDSGYPSDKELWDDDKYIIDSLGWVSIDEQARKSVIARV